MIPWRLQDYIYPSYESAKCVKCYCRSACSVRGGTFSTPHGPRSGMFLFYASHKPFSDFSRHSRRSGHWYIGGYISGTCENVLIMLYIVDLKGQTAEIRIDRTSCFSGYETEQLHAKEPLGLPHISISWSDEMLGSKAYTLYGSSCCLKERIRARKTRWRRSPSLTSLGTEWYPTKGELRNQSRLIIMLYVILKISCPWIFVSTLHVVNISTVILYSTLNLYGFQASSSDICNSTTCFRYPFNSSFISFFILGWEKTEYSNSALISRRIVFAKPALCGGDTSLWR